MKRIALLIVVVLVSLLTQAQSKDSALNRRIAEFMDISRSLDMDKMMDYIYPRIFELAPRKTIAAEMKKAFNSDEATITIDSVRAMTAETITIAGTTQFTRFKFYSAFYIKFAKKDSLEEDMAAAYLEAFNAQFGKENVSYSGETDMFHIRSTKYALAIKDRYSKNRWTFVNQEQSSMLRKLLPAELVKKYKI